MRPLAEASPSVGRVGDAGVPGLSGSLAFPPRRAHAGSKGLSGLLRDRRQDSRWSSYSSAVSALSSRPGHRARLAFLINGLPPVRLPGPFLFSPPRQVHGTPHSFPSLGARVFPSQAPFVFHHDNDNDKFTHTRTAVLQGSSHTCQIFSNSLLLPFSRVWLFNFFLIFYVEPHIFVWFLKVLCLCM